MKLDKQIMRPGVQVEKSLIRRIFTVTVDPLLLFLTIGFTNSLNIATRAEATFFSSAKYNIFRETLATFDGMGFNPFRPQLEANVTASPDDFKMGKTRDMLRERSRASVPIVLIIWYITFMYAFNRNYRTEFSLYMNEVPVPKFTTEVFKRTRTGVLGVARIEVEITTRTANYIVNRYNLYNTFWDPDFLFSPTGLQAVRTLFGYMSNAEGNYVPMVLGSLTNLPNLEAGYTVTYTALTIDAKQWHSTGSDVYVISGNSYGLKAPISHFFDAHATHQTMYEKTASTINQPVTLENTASIRRSNQQIIYSSTNFTVSGNVNAIIGGIVCRVCGIEPNPSWFDPEKSNDFKPQNRHFKKKYDKRENPMEDIGIDNVSASFKTLPIEVTRSLLEKIVPIIYKLMYKLNYNNRARYELQM